MVNKSTPGSSPTSLKGTRSTASSICDNLSSSDRGRLSHAYEGRLGSSGGFRHGAAPSPPEPVATPRSPKKPGVTSFSDARNPFNRTSCKKPSPLEVAKNDGQRAGTRTRTAGVMPCEAREESGGGGGTPQRTGFSFANGYKPGKAGATCPVSGERSPRGHSSAGVGQVLGAGAGNVGWAPASSRPRRHTETTLSNYLNDMKRTARSRGSAPFAEGPSTWTQRLNETRALLPAQVTLSPRRRGGDPASAFRAASADDRETHRRRQRESSQDTVRDVYGFRTRGKSSTPRASSTAPSFLCHDTGPVSPPTTPRAPARERIAADARFGELVDHMKVVRSWNKEQSENTKAKIYKHDGFMYSEQVIKHPV